MATSKPLVKVRIRELSFYYPDARPDAPSPFCAQGFYLHPEDDEVRFAPDCGPVLITVKKTGERIAVRPMWAWNSDVVREVLKPA